MKALSVAGFTNLGYLLHARRFAPVEADLRGKTAVVTGATSGLGLAAAQGLRRLGARVVVVGRDQAKLDAAVRADPGLVPARADLSLLAEVRALADSLLESEPRIDVLVNNVGVLLPERETTAEGLERTFATNLAGQFLLTETLLPRLVASAPARIVNVTSGGMYAERLRPDDLESERGSYSGTTAYARSKRGQVVLTELWAQRLAGTGVVVHAMHPGWARTPGVSGSLPTFNRLMRPLLRTPEQGADTIVWLAAADPPGALSGKLWFDREIVATHLLASTVETAHDRDELWARLSQLTESAERPRQ
jgi:dehydrogenase/reductase SDR family member 12